MANYNIYHGDLVITVSAEAITPTSFGQTVLYDKNGKTLAIIPKETLLIQTEDLTEFKQKIKGIILDLENVGFNDIERKLPNFEDYKQSMEMKRQSLLSYFKNL